ncbi:uncharacterized protein LOC126699825 [Quercus robur]|uniref:uncharacterized protein LOC126699825 n=1 Tax=Quercus robur TaxID=38942 RepID=UPI00216116BE|nr:uncharacterized protein LOC126699825 [Quercus robur]
MGEKSCDQLLMKEKGDLPPYLRCSKVEMSLLMTLFLSRRFAVLSLKVSSIHHFSKGFIDSFYIYCVQDELFGVSESSPLLVEDPPLNDEVATSKKKPTCGVNFSAEEDKLLVAAWLNTSVDPVYGNEQHKTTFYGKVTKYFTDHKADSTRSVASLTTRWGMINRETIKFCGSLAKIEAKNESGTTAHDKLILKDFPKWASTMPREDSRKEMPRTPDSIDQGSGVDGIMDFERPIAVVAIFSEEYLRSPNNEDIARLLAHGQNHGFPGMLGSIDYMHWKWKNCPTAWKGMYCSHIHEPSIILEAVASYDLWIWHSFFGLPGSNNDINVLERSHVFFELAQGRAPAVNYSVNGHDYTMGYYHADGIYPQWSTFVKTIPRPLGAERKLFAKAQEAYRKAVERAFGVLQARFAIVRGFARFFYHETLQDIMKACIILHNMIIEDERDETEAVDLDYEHIDEISCTMSREPTNEFTKFIQVHQCIRDREVHSQLQMNLVEHLWQLQGES